MFIFVPTVAVTTTGDQAMKLANNASHLPGQWAWDTREPDFSDFIRDEAIAEKADEYAEDEGEIADAFHDGITVDLITCREIAKWVHNPDTANTTEILRGLADALYVSHLRAAKNHYEG